ncbi:MAG: OmpA family protein [Deltaproteobacteria bacterium]|nr:OmpA family protein [Deltaproteobacteria bacterium]
MQRREWVCMLIGLVLIMGMAACASQQLSPPPQFTAQPIEKEMWTQKADHLVFVLDASSSMQEGYNGVEKFALARSVVANFNQTMPGLKVNTAVRSFGHDPGVSRASTMALFGPADYSRDGVAAALGLVKKAGGPSSMHKALQQVGADFKSAQGNVALVVVSDGKDMGDAPLAVANGLKAQFKERLCIYTVLVGDDPDGAALMGKLAAVTGCGRTLKAGDVASGAQMAGFVKAVLLSELKDSDGDGVPDASDRCPGTPRNVSVDDKGCPLDEDGDGVYDYLDRCPGTSRNVPVDDKGCPLDSDGDGVYDNLDRCPDTGTGVKVDQFGCPVPTATKSAIVTAEGTWIYKGIHFDNNRAALKASSYPVLDEIVQGMKQQPELKVEIQGHTDISGTHAYNMSLSQRRADAVKAYLVSKGIAAERMITKGYGPDRPIATNTTGKGRADNRRVELKPTY